MKTLTVLCNVVMFGFTCMVLATDGTPTKAAYVVFTLLLLVVPIITVFVLVRSGAGSGPSNSVAIQRAALICNIVMLGLICWALVDQYPHPYEEGFVEYVVLVIVTPILSAVALFFSMRRKIHASQEGVTEP